MLHYRILEVPLKNHSVANRKETYALSENCWLTSLLWVIQTYLILIRLAGSIICDSIYLTVCCLFVVYHVNVKLQYHGQRTVKLCQVSCMFILLPVRGRNCCLHMELETTVTSLEEIWCSCQFCMKLSAVFVTIRYNLLFYLSLVTFCRVLLVIFFIVHTRIKHSNGFGHNFVNKILEFQENI